MKRLIAATALAVIVTAGCSSSVDNPPDVGPTDPTTGNLAPPSTTTLSPNRVLFSPNQGILPYPHDAYFTPTTGVPTDGTLNLPSSAFFPATLRLPERRTPSRWSMRSMDSPRRRRSSCVSPRRSTSPPRRPASGSSKCTSIRRPRRRSAFPTTASPVRRVLVQDVDYRVETAPNIDTGGTLVQIVPLRPLLAEQRRAGRNAPARHRLPGARHERAAGRERRGHRCGRRLRHHQDGRARESANGNCASITDARLNALCNLARAHFGAAGAAGVSPATIVVSSSFTTQSVDTVLRVISATVAASPPPATLVLPVPVATTGAITGPAGPNLANLHFATITLPYYLSAPVAPPTGTGTEPIVTGGARPLRRRPPRDCRTRRTSATCTRFNPIPVGHHAAHRADARLAFRAHRRSSPPPVGRWSSISTASPRIAARSR